MSNEPGAWIPSAPAIWVDACGTGLSRVQVATITVSMSVGEMPASAMALAEARAPIEIAVSSSPAKRRSGLGQGHRGGRHLPDRHRHRDRRDLHPGEPGPTRVHPDPVSYTHLRAHETV